MRSLFIIHFRPISLYPPVINLVRFMSEQKGVKIILYTTSGRKIPHFNKQVEIITVATSSIGLFRWILTLFFYFRVFLGLLSMRSIPVLYYESLSSIPVWFYLSFFKHSKRKFAVHFHEYFSNSEYKGHSFWERMGRKVESSFFDRLSWISHTNLERLNFFLQEFPLITTKQAHVMPNYPPKSWLLCGNKQADYSLFPIKLVYVGSLTLEGTYIKEFVEWLVLQNGKLICDIFSQNADQDLVAYLDEKSKGLISFKGVINYDQLPSKLRQYDVGLILYNGASNNFIYNAPNKLFEYLACGLDVWFDRVLISSRPYEQTETYPKVIMVDFNNLSAFNYQEAIQRTGLSYKPSPYIMEMVYEEFSHKFIQS